MALREGADSEAKAAQGRDGRGEVPLSLWQTYSAFANTEGGIIILGAEETADGSLRLSGVKDPDRIKRDLWNTLNNRQKVSTNLLAERDIEVIAGAEGPVLVMRVPRATRKDRPVYINGNPLAGTFRRNFEGDYPCPETIVRRMLAEAEEDSRDGKILVGFGLEDLDPETLAAYRNLFRTVRPTHPWLAHDDREFLSQLGALAKDRASGHEGLTLAGLLMFGKLRPILDAVPFYIVDYREQPDDTAHERWIDRLTTDGSWSGNLLDFYLKVIRKLSADAKVPFRVIGGHQRVDDSDVHQALREALVNTLIHADYSGRTGILVVKKPEGYAFRNPGSLRLPIDQVERGGRSDCRNRLLQKMFQLVGEGEQAGSGFAKILSAWTGQHWRMPLLREDASLEEVSLELPTVSLLPKGIVDQLEKRFGGAFHRLDEVERVAVATAALEGEVNHRRLRDLSAAHPRDLTLKLQSLVRRKMLVTEGAGRLVRYRLPPQPPEASNTSFPHVVSTLPHSARGGEPNLESASAPSLGRRASPEDVDAAILAFCTADFRTIQEIASALGRSPGTLQNHYVPRLLKEGVLTPRFPDQPRHPQQAYKARPPRA